MEWGIAGSSTSNVLNKPHAARSGVERRLKMLMYQVYTALISPTLVLSRTRMRLFNMLPVMLYES